VTVIDLASGDGAVVAAVDDVAEAGTDFWALRAAGCITEPDGDAGGSIAWADMLSATGGVSASAKLVKSILSSFVSKVVSISGWRQCNNSY
jgi:hypothetical protein